MARLICLAVLLASLSVPAWAADAVAERMSCDEIKAEMDALANGDDAARLETLQMAYRRSCARAAAGRRTTARTAPDESQPVDRDENIVDAIDDFLTKKQDNCKKLGDEIAKLTDVDDATAAETKKRLQAQFDADCVDKTDEQVVAATPEISEEQRAAQIEANIAAGLCADGTNPNKYGCCAGETFRDMGNLVFACCPDAGGDCFPPIK